VTTGGIEPNPLPLATQEISASELGLVDAFGWMLVLWPRSNTEQSDLYQTWMGIETRPDVGTAVAMPATAARTFNCGD